MPDLLRLAEFTAKAIRTGLRLVLAATERAIPCDVSRAEALADTEAGMDVWPGSADFDDEPLNMHPGAFGDDEWAAGWRRGWESATKAYSVGRYLKSETGTAVVDQVTSIYQDAHNHKSPICTQHWPNPCPCNPAHLHGTDARPCWCTTTPGNSEPLPTPSEFCDCGHTQYVHDSAGCNIDAHYKVGPCSCKGFHLLQSPAHRAGAASARAVEEASQEGAIPVAPQPSCDALTLITNVLANHRFIDIMTETRPDWQRYGCYHLGENRTHQWLDDWQGWCDHVAPIITQRIDRHRLLQQMSKDAAADNAYRRFNQFPQE